VGIIITCRLRAKGQNTTNKRWWFCGLRQTWHLRPPSAGMMTGKWYSGYDLKVVAALTRYYSDIYQKKMRKIMKTPHSEQSVLLTRFNLGTPWILVYCSTTNPVCLVSKSMASQESYKITCSLHDNISMLSFSVFMVFDLNKFL